MGTATRSTFEDLEVWKRARNMRQEVTRKQAIDADQGTGTKRFLSRSQVRTSSDLEEQDEQGS